MDQNPLDIIYINEPGSHASFEEASSFIHLIEAPTLVMPMNTFAPCAPFRLSQPDNSKHITDS